MRTLLRDRVIEFYNTSPQRDLVSTTRSARAGPNLCRLARRRSILSTVDFGTGVPARSFVKTFGWAFNARPASVSLA